MISAEHFALKNAAVQSMIAIRERMINYMNDRMNAMGTQAALIAGFAVSTFTSVTISTEVHSEVRTLYFLSTSLAIGAGVHVIINSTFLSVWGPGLALEGPKGSVTRAYNVMLRERWPIYVSFMLMFVSFVGQVVMVLFILEEDKSDNKYFYNATNVTVNGTVEVQDVLVREEEGRKPRGWSHYTIVGTTLMLAWSLFIVCSLLRMYRKFYPLEAPSEQAQYTPQVEHGLPGEAPKEGDLGVPIVNVLGDHPDAQSKPQTARAQTMAEEERKEQQREVVRKVKEDMGIITMEGYLLKQAKMSARMTMMSSEGLWQKRYFKLDGTQCMYWKTKEDYAEAKPPSKDDPIDLAGYEVLVDPQDFRWGFSLKPTDPSDGRRTWNFRASDEDNRIEWTQAFLAATLTAASQGRLSFFG